MCCPGRGAAFWRWLHYPSPGFGWGDPDGLCSWQRSALCGGRGRSCISRSQLELWNTQRISDAGVSNVAEMKSNSSWRGLGTGWALGSFPTQFYNLLEGLYVRMALLVARYHLILWTNDIAYESHFHMGLICLLTTLCCHVSEKTCYFWGYSQSWHSVLWKNKKTTLHSCQECICCPFHLEYHQTGEKLVSYQVKKTNKQCLISPLCL